MDFGPHEPLPAGMTTAEKKDFLRRKQTDTLRSFLSSGAITAEEYARSLAVLTAGSRPAEIASPGRG